MEDRVRESTPSSINNELDREMNQRIRFYAGQDVEALDCRIQELESEKDIEKVLGINMSTLALSGLALGTFIHRKWYVLPAVVVGFFLQHSIQGWCPPLPILRKLGFRTRKEIERERYALKILRGDFDHINSASLKENISEVLRKLDG